MSAVARARRPPSPAFLDPPGYARHRPERTLLYQLVEQHYPAFRELRAAADRPLPDFVLSRTIIMAMRSREMVIR